jgi:hypothetical protein
MLPLPFPSADHDNKRADPKIPPAAVLSLRPLLHRAALPPPVRVGLPGPVLHRLRNRTVRDCGDVDSEGLGQEVRRFPGQGEKGEGAGNLQVPQGEWTGSGSVCM